VKGPRGGYRLSRPPAEITVLEVVEAIDGDEPAFRCTEIRRRGPSAVAAREYRTPCGIHSTFTRADDAWRAELAATTIAELVVGVVEEAPRVAVDKAARWITEAVR
jgi:Rrf2 family protein